MRVSFVRLSKLVVGLALVMSCDGGPVGTKFGNGIAGGATGTSPITPPAPGSVDSFPPFALFTTPVATPVQLINAGDSILVVVLINDDRKLGSLIIRGLVQVGDTALGTYAEVERYPAITAPAVITPFTPGQTSAIIQRYLQPANRADVSTGPLIIQAIVRDSSGNADTTTRTVQLVNGPRVSVLSPVVGALIPRGGLFTINVEATQPSGIDSVRIRVVGESTWPVPLDTTVVGIIPPGVTTVTYTNQINLKLSAPANGRITINASAWDANRNEGTAAPIVVLARAATNVPPLVQQIVDPKLEYTFDSVTVSATADGVVRVGRLLLNSVGATINDVSQTFVGPTFNSTQSVRLPLNLGLQYQDSTVYVLGYADDTLGIRGWSAAAGSTIPVTVQAAGIKAEVRITYGVTYPFPGARPGIAGDIAVDTASYLGSAGNVFVSNTAYNIVEVWSNGTKTFSPAGVQVGAQPWGLFPAYATTQAQYRLLVANSGGTSISRVRMSTTPPAEALSERLKTTNNAVYEVLFTINAAGNLVLSWDGLGYQYSDRPQFVAQSEGGRIFYSTKPTEAKTPGTIRFVDPWHRVADPRQIYSYARYNATATEKYVLFNADSIAVSKMPAGFVGPDTLVVCDHPYGGKHGQARPRFAPGAVDGLGNQLNDTRTDNDDTPFCVRAITQSGAVDSVRKYGGDLEMRLGLDLASLSLTDTTFVATSGDGKWVAFGEGNAAKAVGSGVNRSTPTARLILAKDENLVAPNNLEPQFYSPPITVDDIQENASNKLFGLALGPTGLQVLAHTDQTFVAEVSDPLFATGIFHLRLDGTYDSFSDGGGVAFHPLAMGTITPAPNRIAFTATKTGVIEAFDVAHYNNRGVYTTKGNLYGPLRVTLPLTALETAAGIVLKMYGLTAAGLIVIDLRASDIK